MATRLFFLVVLCISALGTYAQSPTTGGPEPQVPDPAAVPLDGGATLLLASGVAYGARRLRARRAL
jgi:hypothetical protein